MAKIIFYLHAPSGADSGDALIDQARALAKAPILQAHQAHLCVMTPRSEDILAVPPDTDFLAHLDVVLEIVFPHGQPLKAVQSALGDAMAPVLAKADCAHSHLVLGYHRTFQESGSRPIRYHYFMYRRSDYSRADYMDYYAHSHYQFGVVTPLADYYQNYLDIEGGAELAEFFGVGAIGADNISELRFDSVEDYLFSDTIAKVGPAAVEDEGRFVNRDICQSFTMDVLLDTRDYG